MEEEKRKAYSEVVEILKLIENEELIEKLPFEVVELIKNNSDPTYKPNISKDVPLEEQNLRNETYSIMMWLATKYWGEEYVLSQKENNDEITVQTNENNNENKIEEETQFEENIKNASVYNDIDPAIIENTLPILAQKEGWFKRVKMQVIKFLKTLFKISKKNAEEGVNE